MANRDLVVRFIGDDRDLQRAFTTSERRATVFQSRMTRLNQSLRGGLAGSGIGARGSLLFGSGAFIGTAAVTAGMRESIEAASDLNEQMARSRQVFDESADSIEDWSKGLASSFGIAQAQGLQFAGTFGLLFRNLGSSAPEAEKLSKQLVQLAADMASFNNTDIESALVALRSGLTGEVEPLRKFGVFLSEARSNLQALSDTGKKSTADLTTQEKVLARLNLVMQDTARTQGDFARTSDSLANKQRIAAAETENLSASLGKALAPAMDIALISTIALVGGLNDLITGMGDLRVALRESDMFSGFNAAIEEANAKATGFFEGLRDNIPLLNEVARLRGAVIGGGTSFAIPDRPEEGRGALDAAAGRAEQIEKDTAKAKRDQERVRKAFDEFVKGMGLKFDKARLTADTGDDLAALRELERAILRRIAAEGKTFKLVSQLTAVRLQIQSTVARPAEDAREAAIDAFEATRAALDLQLDIAQASASFADDQAALRAIEQAILDRIEAEGRSTDLLRQLFQVRQQQEDVARQVREQQAQRRKESQFKALGLTAEGDQPTPGAGALLRRARSLEDQIKGTVLDTAKNRQVLNNIVRLLKTQFKNVGRDVRKAILEMLNDISNAFETGDEKIGNLTKRRITAADLQGSVSAFGMNIPQAAASAGSGTIHIHLDLDGKEVSNVVLKEGQLRNRRQVGTRAGRMGGTKLF